ncbi:glutamate ligase domain-containing protein [Erythrobacter sp. HA6-11]
MAAGSESSATEDGLERGRYFFCGIGGSGMLPLAQIVHGIGDEVAGSDRSYDQGRTPEKFAWLKQNGFKLFPQDGSGITSPDQVLIASAAIEDTVPEVAKARELGCERLTRAELLSELFNASGYSFAVAGTSGKSTVTGMLGWILQHEDHDPTIMNGAVMKNFISKDNPFASAKVGSPNLFVSEVDESDGSIALYRPTVGLLLNVSLDHKSMEELRVLFGDYLKVSGCAVVNADDQEALALAEHCDPVVTFSAKSEDADIAVSQDTIEAGPLSISAAVMDNRDHSVWPLILPMPGMHNLSNALAAIAAASAAGIEVSRAVYALRTFAGLGRRFDVIGTTANDITVIDDFGHNPEKCAATLRTLKASRGRVIAFFQPHGYGPLRQMGHELAETFAHELGAEDMSIMCDPVYFGGTVDRSEGTERIIGMIKELGGNAEHIASRDDCGERILELTQPGDRIVIMGARDDTLSVFAKSIFDRLG